MNEKDKMKLKKIKTLVENEEDSILNLGNVLLEEYYFDGCLDEKFEVYLDRRISEVESVSTILSHKVEVLKRLSESFRSFE